MPPASRTLTTAEYRNPESLDPGGVLVVGAAASGVADRRRDPPLGRPVTLAVGEHVRAPRITAAGTSNGGWTPPA